MFMGAWNHTFYREHGARSLEATLSTDRDKNACPSEQQQEPTNEIFRFTGDNYTMYEITAHSN